MAGDTDGSGKLRASLRLDASEINQDDLDGDDDSLDGMLLEASLQFEENNPGGTGNGQGKENISGRFPIVSDADIEKDVSMFIPAKTRKQTNWCHNVWLAWRESRIKQYPPYLIRNFVNGWVNFYTKHIGKTVVNMVENLCTSCFVAFNNF